jgi:hypothetical protein
MILAAAATLAIGGVVTGTALASAATPAPAGNQVAPAAPDTPEAGDTPDSPAEAGKPEAPEPGEVAGQDTDNVQHEATGDEGNHADEPGAPTK